jgi:hypothetical protein
MHLPARRFINMRVTIQEDGRIEPPDAAQLLLTEHQQVTNADFTKGDANMRTFICPECRENFEAVPGRVTVHDCDED